MSDSDILLKYVVIVGISGKKQVHIPDNFINTLELCISNILYLCILRTINRDLLIRELAKLGTCEYVLNWFIKCYLSNRSQNIRYKNDKPTL